MKEIYKLYITLNRGRTYTDIGRNFKSIILFFGIVVDVGLLSMPKSEIVGKRLFEV